MYHFFYNLFYSIFSGENHFDWSPEVARTCLNNMVMKLGELLLNVFGGSFESYTAFNWQTQTTIGSNVYTFLPVNYICAFFALIVFAGIVFAVVKVVKSLFNIFFYGWRN